MGCGIAGELSGEGGVDLRADVVSVCAARVRVGDERGGSSVGELQQARGVGNYEDELGAMLRGAVLSSFLAAASMKREYLASRAGVGIGPKATFYT